MQELIAEVIARSISRKHDIRAQVIGCFGGLGHDAFCYTAAPRQNQRTHEGDCAASVDFAYRRNLPHHPKQGLSTTTSRG
jgi:hypothetical protein